jgi:hypothetical protein
MVPRTYPYVSTTAEGFTASTADIAMMAALFFTCPITPIRLQHWLNEDKDASEDDRGHLPRLHFVNRKGKVFGGDEE